MRLHCFSCNQTVSTEVPASTVLRGLIQCPECIEKEADVPEPMPCVPESVTAPSLDSEVAATLSELGYTCENISRLLGVSEKTVKAIMQKQHAGTASDTTKQLALLVEFSEWMVEGELKGFLKALRSLR